MLRAAVLSALLAVAGPAHAWSEADTRRQAGYFVLHAVDWGQTLSIAESDRYYERNPVLGRDPSRGAVNRYFLLTGLAHYGISRTLPAQYRKWWQRVSIVLRAETVHHNYSVGVDIRF